MNRALIVIDAQQDYATGGRATIAYPPLQTSTANLATALSAAAAAGIPLVVVRQVSPAGSWAFAEGSPGAQLLPQVAAAPAALVVDKRLASALAGTDLDAWLRVSGVLPGRTVDITAARRYRIADKVLAFLGLLADLGYVGLHPDAIVGYKRRRGEKTLPPGRQAANIAIASLRAIGERANAQLNQFKVLASDFRSSPTQITLAVKAVQSLQHWTRDPFGTNQTVTNP